MKKSRTERSRSGFTLVELLVVIAVIAILGVIGVVVFTNVQTNAKISATKSELTQLREAMIRYKLNVGELPPVGDSCPNCIADNEARATNLRSGLLAALVAATGGGPYIDNVEQFVYDTWGQAYYYDDNDTFPSNIPPQSPCQGNTQTSNSPLYSTGPDKATGGGDDIHFDIRCP